MEEKKSYYAIIPAEVRYSKIPANAKLLYGEITALCNEKGYCWASNQYFAKLYEVSPTSISLWIKHLREGKFIDYEICDGYQRKIYLKGVLKKFKGGIKKSERGVLKKFKHNNTVNNTTNIKDNKKTSSLNFLRELTDIDISEFTEKYKCSAFQVKGKAEDIINYCESKGKVYKNYKATLRSWIKKDFGILTEEDKLNKKRAEATREKVNQNGVNKLNNLKASFKIGR